MYNSINTTNFDGTMFESAVVLLHNVIIANIYLSS